MLERFTKPARVTVERAVVVARETGAESVRPEHLFAALLEDEKCLASRVLTGLGAPPAALREDLASRRSRFTDGLDEDDAAALATLGIDLEEVLRRVPAAGPSRRGRPRFSRPARKVMELSLREAVALRHNYIGTEHLLLGLVREGDASVRDVADGVRRDAGGPAPRRGGRRTPGGLSARRPRGW